MTESMQHTLEGRAGNLLPQWASVNRVVLDLLKHYEPAFNVKRIATGLDLDPVVPLTWGDRALLKRGFGGILGHAVKSSSPGGFVVVRTTLREGFVTFTVGENGAATDDDRVEELLKNPRLYSDDDLAIAREIVTAHGGQIGIDTGDGFHSCCVVRLPGVALENARLSEELEESRRDGRELLATLSYELRTPLHGIMGYTDLLLEGTFGPLTQDQGDTVRRIDQGAKELLGLVEHAIDARSEDGDHLVLGAGVELPQRLQSFCQLAIEALDCDTCLAFVWQPASEVFVPAAGGGLPSRGQEWLANTRLTGAQVARLLPRDQGTGPVIVMEPRELLSDAVSKALGLHSVCLLPVHRNGELLGMLMLGYARRPYVFNAEHRHFAEGISDLAGLAMENSHLSEQIDQVQRVTAEFVSTMSHHSRIPLNIIIGYSDLLHEGEFGPLSGEQKSVTQRLRATSRELLEVINRNLSPDQPESRHYDA